MARPLRLHLPGTYYHVMSRGNDKRHIFLDDHDYQRFLGLLAKALARFKTLCLAFSLMRNHYHLLVSPREQPISRMMQQLNSAYCQGFNRKHGRVGHVTEGRFTSRHVDTDSYLLTALRYIVLNPVVAGCVGSPELWPWSSYQATAGLEPSPDFLALERIWPAFDTTQPAVGRHRFILFVAAGAATEPGMADAPLVLGSDAFARQITPLLDPHKETRDFPYSQRYATRPPLAEIFAGRSTRQTLQDAAYDAFGQHAYTLREIGGVVNRTPSTVWTWIKSTEARRIEKSGVRSRFFDSRLL